MTREARRSARATGDVRDELADPIVGGGRGRGIRRTHEDHQRAHGGAGLVEQMRILRDLGAREDATPHRELRGRLPLFGVPAREDPERGGIFFRAGEQIVHRLRAGTERASRVGTAESSRSELRQVLERDGVHALGLAEVAAPRAEAPEPEIRLLARGVERQRIHVATEREVVFARDLVGVRDLHELEGARRVRRSRCGREARPEERDREGEGSTLHVTRIALPPRRAGGTLETMWPFGKKRATRLASSAPSGAPTEVRVEVVVASPNDVTSELTGLRAALFLVTLVERRPVYRESGAGSADEVADTYVELGSIMWGDTLVLRDDDGTEVTVAARRAFIGFATPHHGGTPLARVPPALAPMMSRASGRGVLCFRENPIRQGDRYRLTAAVEAVPAVVSSGYRSGAGLRFIARDDVSPIKLEEIFEVPDF